jgi:hypothetical protein
MTAFGDLFLRDDAGHVHFLDLMAGEFTQVATSQEEFDRLCDVRGQRRTWFIGILAVELRKLHGDLAAGECYGCKVPLSLGGKLDADNFARTDLRAHYSVLGRLHQQTKHMRAGANIDSVKVKSSSEDTKPKSWWNRLKSRGV